MYQTLIDIIIVFVNLSWDYGILWLHCGAQVWREKYKRLINNCDFGVATTPHFYILSIEIFHFRDKFNHSFGNADINSLCMLSCFIHSTYGIALCVFFSSTYTEWWINLAQYFPVYIFTTVWSGMFSVIPKTTMLCAVRTIGHIHQKVSSNFKYFPNPQIHCNYFSPIVKNSSNLLTVSWSYIYKDYVYTMSLPIILS